MTFRFLNALYGSLEEHFPEEPPALLHGDLWAGNYMVVKGGLPALFDPAVYYGHRYLDLGYDAALWRISAPRI